MKRWKGTNLEVHRWAERYQLNIGLAMPAQQLAVGAGIAYELISILRSRQLDARLPPRPDPERWLLLYQNLRGIWQKVADVFPTVWGSGTDVIKMLDAAAAVREEALRDRRKFRRRLASLGRRRLLEMWRRGFREGWKIYYEHLRELRAWFHGSKDSSGFDEAIKLPELQLFLQVMLPCFVLYQANPRTLLRRADRRQDVNAIEILLRLDPLLFAHPAVMRWVNGGTGADRRLRNEMATCWMAEGPTCAVTRAGIKQSFGGLISALADGLARRLKRGKIERYKLTARQIRELFDAVAMDQGFTTVALGGDQDLTMTLESWQKAIQRQRKLWRKGIPLRVDTRGRISSP